MVRLHVKTMEGMVWKVYSIGDHTIRVRVDHQ